ncbi:MAG TPA: DUF4926 domain-containing protein [Verrucomicrobiae bacterium]|jgi:hypothetical protein
MIQELERVVLTTDVPKHGLAKGDVGTVVLVIRSGEGYMVEFMTLTGKTVAVATLEASQVRPIAPSDIANARQVALAEA